ncbi:SCO2583 family membrane protein [Streptomyces sp. TP-A0874]|uniref:SCO2583 family membrane protein n=1 Tax=Streptomyces sp. TP-A0874 TaxID=549819 RepID=UPI000853EEF3|nr:hypothetical protein [Streptomyces sp. TP-A0874]
MTGSGDPPEGAPEGAPGGGDEEYRSVVFDESFIRAARLQEFSAQERVEDRTPAVRSRRSWARRGGSRQVMVLAVLITLAFATAVYLGVRGPVQRPVAVVPEPLRATVIPLAPRGAVPGGKPQTLFEHSPAAQFRVGAEGVTLPSAGSTEHFSDSQVLSALDTAKEYIVRSALDPAVLTGKAVRPVRLLLDPAQVDQYDRSMERPVDDGRHPATGWLVRFDPAKVVLADPQVRVEGTLSVSEVAPDQLEVVSDHTFVYALRRVGKTEPADRASLFTVRRELRFRLDRGDLRDHHVELRQSHLEAGPMDCSAKMAEYLRPLLAGERAGTTGPAGTDPYTSNAPTTSLCGVLAGRAQPSPPR